MPSAALWTPGDWACFLSAHLDASVQVEYGRSRLYPIQVWAQGAGGERSWLVRLNGELFEDAPEAVREALGSWMHDGSPRAAERVDAWLHERSELAPPSPRATLTPPTTVGHEHDLAHLALPLFERTFVNAFRSSSGRPILSWGRRARSRGRRSLRLGSYDPSQNLVRVHPVLDQAAVPGWFVRYIVFHELLHAALPTCRDSSGRWIHHPPQFRYCEERYPDHRRALAWEALNVARLIRSASSGRPLRVLSRDHKALRLDGEWDARSRRRLENVLQPAAHFLHPRVQLELFGSERGSRRSSP